MMRSSAACAAAASAALGIATASSGAVTTYTLLDHPGGSSNPPPYGLRLDGALQAVGGAGGTTSFSFDAAFNDPARTDVTLVYDDVAETLTISGEVYGGEDSGSGYSFGEGWYDLNFVYSANVIETGNGMTVTAGHLTLNAGSLTAQGNADLLPGTAIDFYDTAMANSFLMLPDGHRLPNDDTTMVGRGWVSVNPNGSGAPSGQYNDWLFIAVPTPSSSALLAVGLLAIRRRR